MRLVTESLEDFLKAKSYEEVFPTSWLSWQVP